jgi:hypothetical protein
MAGCPTAAAAAAAHKAARRHRHQSTSHLVLGRWLGSLRCRCCRCCCCCLRSCGRCCCCLFLALELPKEVVYVEFCRSRLAAAALCRRRCCCLLAAAGPCLLPRCYRCHCPLLLLFTAASGQLGGRCLSQLCGILRCGRPLRCSLGFGLHHASSLMPRGKIAETRCTSLSRCVETLRNTKGLLVNLSNLWGVGDGNTPHYRPNRAEDFGFGALAPKGKAQLAVL